MTTSERELAGISGVCVAVFVSRSARDATLAKPARAGESLILTITGLGPTRPGLTPGRPFPDTPTQEVNSPLEVTVNGKPADVMNKFGWPGTTDTYRVDIRVPDGTASGTATLQITAAFIAGREMKIPVQ